MKILKNRGGALIVVFIFSLVLVAVALQGCTPRNASFCLKNNEWVKCPKGVKVGTDLDLRGKK